MPRTGATSTTRSSSPSGSPASFSPPSSCSWPIACSASVTRRGRRAAYEPENKRLEWWLTIVTAVGVAAMLAPGLFVWNQFVTVPEEATEFEVVGQQWQWSFRLPGKDGRLGTCRYPLRQFRQSVRPQSERSQRTGRCRDRRRRPAPAGRQAGQGACCAPSTSCTISTCPQFRAKMDMVPGIVTYFWFTPTRTGTFEILCAELCGVGHPHMRGKVVVDERERLSGVAAAAADLRATVG